jgi:ABC-type xylose transport system permease subunit
VLVGGTSLLGGVGSLTGTLVGALLLALVLNGMNLLNIHSNWQPLVTGSIVLVAAVLDIITRRHAEARA